MKSIIYTSFLLIFAINLIAQSPVFSPTTVRNDVISQQPLDCGPDALTLEANAYSLCSKSPKLRYSYKIDFNNDGVFDIFGNGKSVILSKSNGLKYGRHSIQWKVTDACGNSTTAQKVFLVLNRSKPIPVASLLNYFTDYDKLQYVISKENIKNSSYDKCYPPSSLRYRLALEGEYSKNMTLDNVLSLNDYIQFNFCKESGTKKLAFFVINPDNNWDYTELTFDIPSTNQYICDSLSQFFIGNISSHSGRAIEGIPIFCNNILNDSTNKFGNFSFKPIEKTIEIKPESNETINRDGINSADFVFMSQYINKIYSNVLNPYMKIAADLNSDNKIDSLDKDILRDIVLFIKDYPNIKNFVFVPKNYVFTTDTFNFPKTIVVDSSNKSDKVDFIAIKMGDVAGNYFTEALERKDIPNLPIVIQNQSFRKGDEVTMKLKLPKSDAFSFTFQFDPTLLEYKTINGIDSKNYNLKYVQDGFITLLNINELDSEKEFEFEFLAKRKGQLIDAIEINSKMTKAELIRSEEEIYSIYLDFKGEVKSENPLQCDPNPFTYYTNIKYISDKISKIHWKLIDLRGQKIKEGSQDTQIGINQFQISGESITTNGTYILQIFTDSDILTSKLIFIK